jgi:hypothetical protein
MRSSPGKDVDSPVLNFEWCDPLSSQAHIEAGAALFTQRRSREALLHFLCALGEDPKHPVAHYLSGLVFQSLGLVDEARAEWNVVVEVTTLMLQSPEPLEEAKWAHEAASELLRHTAEHK